MKKHSINYFKIFLKKDEYKMPVAKIIFFIKWLLIFLNLNGMKKYLIFLYGNALAKPLNMAEITVKLLIILILCSNVK